MDLSGTSLIIRERDEVILYEKALSLPQYLRRAILGLDGSEKCFTLFRKKLDRDLGDLVQLVLNIRYALDFLHDPIRDSSNLSDSPAVTVKEIQYSFLPVPESCHFSPSLDDQPYGL
jgi:hypothetical protein